MMEAAMAGDSEGKYHIVAAVAAGTKGAVIVGLLHCCFVG
jgi:hypothetical protein